MDYELSDTHRLIRDTARRIAREKVAPRAAELDESGEYPEDIFRVFAEAGLLGLTISEVYRDIDSSVTIMEVPLELSPAPSPTWTVPAQGVNDGQIY